MDLSTITAEDVALMGVDELTELVQRIAGRLLEISAEMQRVEPRYRSLKAEAAYLSEVKSAVQSSIRVHRMALEH